MLVPRWSIVFSGCLFVLVGCGGTVNFEQIVPDENQVVVEIEGMT
jgi:hypothetical protein